MSELAPEGTTITVPVVEPPKTEPKVEPTKTFTEADLERARQQEKDKLYSRLEELNKTVKSLQQVEQERQAEIQRKADEKAQQAEAKRLEEASAKDLIKDANQTWEERFAQLQQERDAEKALREKEAQFFALQQYIQKRVSEESDTIAPELLEFVSGNNEQEVEVSIAKAKTATSNLLESLAAAGAGQPQQAPNLRGVPVTGYGPVGGPGDQTSQTRTYTAEEINNIPVGSPEYLALRASMGIGGGGQGRGLFG